MLGHRTNEDPAPPQYVETSALRITETYIAWRKIDRLFLGWIIGTLSEETLGLVVGLDTTNAIWEALKNAYTEDS